VDRMIAEFPARQWKQRTFYTRNNISTTAFGNHVNINK